jgi:hypothetical protein
MESSIKSNYNNLHFSTQTPTEHLPNRSISLTTEVYARDVSQLSSSESLTEAPDLVAGLWRPLYVEWRNYAINYVKRPMFAYVIYIILMCLIVLIIVIVCQTNSDNNKNERNSSIPHLRSFPKEARNCSENEAAEMLQNKKNGFGLLKLHGKL